MEQFFSSLSWPIFITLFLVIFILSAITFGLIRVIVRNWVNSLWKKSWSFRIVEVYDNWEKDKYYVIEGKNFLKPIFRPVSDVPEFRAYKFLTWEEAADELAKVTSNEPRFIKDVIIDNVKVK